MRAMKERAAAHSGETGHGAPGSDLPALLGAAGRGDESAWRRLIDLYARRVYALVKSRVRRDDLAEELTQSVFATVAAKLGSGQYGEQGRFEAWLFRIAMNRVRDEVRRAKHRPEATDPQAFEQSVASRSAGGAESDEAGIRRLRTAMADLADSDREVVELRHHGGMSFKHIAELLGQPLGTVLARHHRALKKLKEILGASESGEDGAISGGGES